MTLDVALRKFITNDKSATTHTKIGNPDLKIFGQKYAINPENEKSFYETYQHNVFKEGQEAYLTEKQLDIGKLAIDLDFRYDQDVKTKQHSKEHLDDFVEMLSNGLYDIFQNIEGKKIRFHVFEKQNVNVCDDKTKDGIHILINVICDFPTKMVFRDYILANIEDIWDDLPITNTWNDVVDEGVMRGSVNWQLYGSKKPGYEPYKLKYIYETCVKDAREMEIKHIDPCKEKFDFFALSVRSTKNCVQFELKPLYIEAYQKHKSSFHQKREHKGGGVLKIKKRSSVDSLANIQSLDDIKTLAENMMDDPDVDYSVKEIHRYTMSLPKEFWGPGSYTKWIKTGWALKNTGNMMILTWLLFSSQSSDFDVHHNDVLEYWDNFDVYNKEGLTYRSIIYWSKINNYDAYLDIYKTTISHYIEYSFRNNTEFDLATTLFHMFKSQYVCVSIKDNIWFEFLQNKWSQIDSGNTLRLKISTEMYKQYANALFEYQNKSQAKQNNIDVVENTNAIISDNSDDFGDYKKKVNDMLATCKLLKKTNTKNNIMKEAKELFYDKDFLNKLDKDSYLLGCNNGVIDFRDKCHRKGKHEDYISKTTNLNYTPLSYYQKHKPHIIEEINEFMCQLFPNESEDSSLLRNYMWEHMASTLLGTNHSQTFNIYTGSGANGKSKLVELLTLVLGEYKGTVPISLVTQKRNNIGGTSSEVYNLIGTRYAVMQEPSKGDKINEGIMKELTGGDPIQCRALFKDSVTFVPQFKLVVCTNTLFDIVSNDDGTWRRLRKVDFQSKFTEKPFDDPKFPVEEYPHQFQVDQKIDEKFVTWAPVLLSMLVDLAYKTQGKVQDVDPVTSATEDYRKDQDILTAFYNEMIVANPNRAGYGVKIMDITKKFAQYVETYSGSTDPRIQKELRPYMEKKHGKCPPGGWTMIQYRNTAVTAEEEGSFT